MSKTTVHAFVTLGVSLCLVLMSTASCLCSEVNEDASTVSLEATSVDTTYPVLPQEELENAFQALAIMQLSPPIPLQDFALPNTSGETINTMDLRGQFIWINLWSAGCDPCLNELPAMQSLWEEYKDTGLFTILAVDIADSRERVMQVIQDKKLTLPIMLDENGAIWRMYGSGYFPTNLFVDPDGLIIGAAIGARNWDNAELEALLNRFTQHSE